MKEYDAYMVESKDDPVSAESMVCVSPYNTTTNEWLSGLMEITSMDDLLRRKEKENKKVVAKDDNVKIFFDKYFELTKSKRWKLLKRITKKELEL